MTKPCIVRNCRTGDKSLKVKRSVFKVPKNEEMRKKWKSAIPGITSLKDSHCVCEKHFNEEDILRKYVSKGRTGQIIAEVAYKYPRLEKFAVPSIFLDDDGMQKSQSLNIKCESSQCDTLLDSLDIQKPTSTNGCIKVEPPQETSSVKLETEEDNQIINQLSYTALDYPENDIEDLDSPISYYETSEVTSTNNNSYLVSSKNSPERDIDMSPILMREGKNDLCGASNSDNDYQLNSITIPKTWHVIKKYVEEKECLIFSYLRIVNGSDGYFPITDKYVMLDTKKRLSFFVLGRCVNPTKFAISPVLINNESLPDILTKFENMSVCNGVGDMSNYLLDLDKVFANNLGQWHYIDCTLLTTRLRCEACTKSRKVQLQKESGYKKPPDIYGITTTSNPID